ncbi:MAG: hypothetical protein II308_03700, partial [Muribaculaceae bacterium]|nr:hypothetical protein [Muribaculaceae bacterium]
QKNANDNLSKPECQQKENSFCETKSEWRQEYADDNFAKPEWQQKDESDNKAKPEWLKMYDQALANDYRFLSYGDSSLLTTW